MSRFIAPLRSCQAIPIIALSAAMLGHSGAWAQDEASRGGERARLEARMERLIADVEATERLADTLNDELIDLVGDDTKLRTEFYAVSARVAELERGVFREEAALSELSAQSAVLAAELAEEERGLALVLAALQRMGLRPPPALLASGTPLTMVRGAIVLNATVPLLDEAARSLAARQLESDRLAATQRGKWSRVRDNLNELVEERARLSRLRDELERRRALSVYERDQAAASLARLTEESANVAELLDAVVRGRARPPAIERNFTDRRGQLALPVAGRVVGEFGDELPAGGLSEGLLLSALPGSTVFSPISGTVLFSEPFRSFGNVLILDGGDGYHVVLVGLNEVFTNSGASVATGAPLGRMGRATPRAAAALGRVGADESDSVDSSSRPTLYVELRRDGAAFDSHGWWRDARPEVKRTVE